MRSMLRPDMDIVLKTDGLLPGKAATLEDAFLGERDGRVDADLSAMNLGNVLTRIARNARHDVNAGLGRATGLDCPKYVGGIERINVLIDDHDDLRPGIAAERGQERILRLILVLLLDRDDAAEYIARGRDVPDAGNERRNLLVDLGLDRHADEVEILGAAGQDRMVDRIASPGDGRYPKHMI